MNENSSDRVHTQHEETVQHSCERKEREQERKERERALVEQVHRNVTEQGRVGVPATHEPPTIPSTELPAPQPQRQLYEEWNFYRREVGKLLAEGHEGRFVLIKGENVVGIWDTREEAEAAARQKYWMQPCLIHQVRSREPLLRVSSRLRRWPS